jgi:hypothetical protein
VKSKRPCRKSAVGLISHDKAVYRFSWFQRKKMKLDLADTNSVLKPLDGQIPAQPVEGV